MHGEEVKDFSLVTVEMEDGGLCIAECAYIHSPAPWTPRVEFSLHTKRYQYRSLGRDGMLWSDQHGSHNFLEAPLDNGSFYPAFVADTIDAFWKGRALIAGIEDDLAALRIVDAAYSSAARSELLQVS